MSAAEPNEMIWLDGTSQLGRATAETLYLFDNEALTPRAQFVGEIVERLSAEELIEALEVVLWHLPAGKDEEARAIIAEWVEST